MGEKAFPTKKSFIFIFVFSKSDPKIEAAGCLPGFGFYIVFFLGLVGVKQGWVMGGQNVSNGSHQN